MENFHRMSIRNDSKIMSLKVILLEDQKAAMKARDSEKLSVLRMLASEIKNKEIDAKQELDDSAIIKVIGSQVKKLKDALQDFVSAGRSDLQEQTQKEIEILNAYLPEQMSEEKLRELVMNIIAEVSANGKEDFPKVMGLAMQRTQGVADGNQVKEIVMQLLET